MGPMGRTGWAAFGRASYGSYTSHVSYRAPLVARGGAKGVVAGQGQEARVPRERGTAEGQREKKGEHNRSDGDAESVVRWCRRHGITSYALGRCIVPGRWIRVEGSESDRGWGRFGGRRLVPQTGWDHSRTRGIYRGSVPQ